ncbi:hypothetical protein V6N13_053701 [Hibiscus sabdariffa]|uniref:Uncharacterized protein n=1 Tax=Hibiscus sabdariffa TaxID=183260 RepID=A0ABR2T6S4_9ROSI
MLLTRHPKSLVFPTPSQIWFCSFQARLLFSPAFFSGRLNKNSAQCLFRVRPFTSAATRRILPPKIHAFSTTFIETKPTAPIVAEKEDSGGASGLACPICYDPLTRISDSPLYV